MHHVHRDIPKIYHGNCNKKAKNLFDHDFKSVKENDEKNIGQLRMENTCDDKMRRCHLCNNYYHENKFQQHALTEMHQTALKGDQFKALCLFVKKVKCELFKL